MSTETCQKCGAERSRRLYPQRRYECGSIFSEASSEIIHESKDCELSRLREELTAERAHADRLADALARCLWRLGEEDASPSDYQQFHSSLTAHEARRKGGDV